MGVVKVTKGCDRTPTLSKVVLIHMWSRDRLGADIKGPAGKISNVVVVGVPKRS